MGGIGEWPVNAGFGRLEPTFDHAVNFSRLQIRSSRKQKQGPTGMRNHSLSQQGWELMKLDLPEFTLQGIVKPIPAVRKTAR